jgi:hypothetical protein
MPSEAVISIVDDDDAVRSGMQRIFITSLGAKTLRITSESCPGIEETMHTPKQRTNQRALKLAYLDWRKYYDKQTQEKLLAGCAIPW